VTRHGLFSSQEELARAKSANASIEEKHKDIDWSDMNTFKNALFGISLSEGQMP